MAGNDQAKKDTSVNTAEDQKDKKDKKKGGSLFVWFGPLFLAIIFFPTTFLWFVMMLPTAIAIIIDKNRPRTLATTVGTINFSGALAGWLELLDRGHNMDNAQVISTDLDYLLIAYGSALVGYFIYANIVPIVGRIASRAADVEKRRIEVQQSELENVWGGEVKNAGRK